MFGKTQVPLEICHITWGGIVFFPIPPPHVLLFLVSSLSVYQLPSQVLLPRAALLYCAGPLEQSPHPLPRLLLHLSLFSWGGGGGP